MSSGDNRLETPNNHGPLVAMIATVALVWSLLVFCIRIFIRYRMAPPFGFDDSAATVSLLLAVGQAAATLTAVHHGLGRHRDTLNNSQIHEFLDSTYAASVCYILSNATSKISNGLLIARLTRRRRHLIASYSTVAFIAAWGSAAAIVLCIPLWHSVPEFYDHRSGRFVRWAIIEGISIVVEALLFFLSVFLVWALHLPLKTKAIVVAAFLCRTLIIIPTILRLRSLKKALNDQDFTFASAEPAIITQVVLHFSFIAATFPCMKRFLQVWNTNLGHTVHMGGGNGRDYGYGYGSNASGSRSTPSGSRTTHASIKDADKSIQSIDEAIAMDKLHQGHNMDYPLRQSSRHGQHVHQDLTSQRVRGLSICGIEGNQARDNEGTSLAESDASDKAIIRVTQKIEVTYDKAEDDVYGGRM